MVGGVVLAVVALSAVAGVVGLSRRGGPWATDAGSKHPAHGERDDDAPAQAG
ncbi:MAG TPA: hypothetical protein VK306_04030 [Acidimicrobiales bacterium]|nr:hypothetical protein [Acidimicrobiales bacterium]